jgi:hypothetical protein
MSEKIEGLIERCRTIKMSPAQQADQRRSFVFGNCNIDNEAVTREIVEAADKKRQGLMPGVPG